MIELILQGRIDNNIKGLKWVLSKGCEPKIFVETISEMLANDKIIIEGKFNKQASKIHKVDVYNIRVL